MTSINYTEIVTFAAIIFLPYIPLKLYAMKKRREYLQSDEHLVSTLGMNRAELIELSAKYTEKR